MKKISSIILIILGLGACSLVPPNNDVKKFNFLELSINNVHTAIRNDEISCQQLISRYVKRIKHYDESSKLNAIVYLNPHAVHEAMRLDKKYYKNNKMKKLHCIPVILKDNFDTADMPTEAGAIALKGSIPPDDAFMVKKLKSEDAIIVAKSNMGEWAFSPYNTISSTHGETRNAYDLDRVPAGSSGGTASAVAANFGIIGMGTDTGNSIRGPASHLSLVGIRSTIGATSRDGIVPLLLNRDIGGPLMRTVTDTAIVYSIIAGQDPADPITHKGKGKVQPDYKPYLKKDGLKGTRLGLIRQLYESENSDPEVLTLMDKAVEDLKKAGAIIIDPFEVKDFEKLSKATGFCSRFPFDLNNYLTTLGDNSPLKSFDQMIEGKLYRKENQGPMNWAKNGVDDPELQEPPCTDVDKDPRRANFLKAIVEAMNNQNVNAIIYPSWSNPPRLVGDLKSPHGNNSPKIAPHTGQPAITVPMGFTKSGLPTGLQFLARPFDEHLLFKMAYAYEQATKHRTTPSGFGSL